MSYSSSTHSSCPGEILLVSQPGVAATTTLQHQKQWMLYSAYCTLSMYPSVAQMEEPTAARACANLGMPPCQISPLLLKRCVLVLVLATIYHPPSSTSAFSWLSRLVLVSLFDFTWPSQYLLRIFSFYYRIKNVLELVGSRSSQWRRQYHVELKIFFMMRCADDALWWCAIRSIRGLGDRNVRLEQSINQSAMQCNAINQSMQYM